MDDLHLTRRQALKSAAAGAALGVLAGPTAAFADGGDDDEGRGRVRWDIVLVVTTPCVQPGGFASAFAQDGSKITVTGSGTFPNVRHRCAKDVTGGGTWTIASTGADPNCFSGSGKYRVTELLDWTPAPPKFPAGLQDCIGQSADATSGLAKLRVRYDNGTHGVLTVSCDLPGQGHLTCMFEGITASMEYEDFYRSDQPQPGVEANRTIFHFLRGTSDDRDDG
jgi:hypothetical protein